MSPRHIKWHHKKLEICGPKGPGPQGPMGLQGQSRAQPAKYVLALEGKKKRPFSNKRTQVPKKIVWILKSETMQDAGMEYVGRDTYSAIGKSVVAPVVLSLNGGFFDSSARSSHKMCSIVGQSGYGTFDKHCWMCFVSAQCLVCTRRWATCASRRFPPAIVSSV